MVQEEQEVMSAPISPFDVVEVQLPVPAASDQPPVTSCQPPVSDEDASQGTKGNKITSWMDAVGSVPASSDANASGATGQVPVARSVFF